MPATCVPQYVPRANMGLSKHGDPVFPHLWSWNQNLARVCARGGGGYLSFVLQEALVGIPTTVIPDSCVVYCFCCLPTTYVWQDTVLALLWNLTAQSHSLVGCCPCLLVHVLGQNFRLFSPIFMHSNGTVRWRCCPPDLRGGLIT